MDRYVTLFKLINVSVVVAEFVLIIIAIMSRDIISVEAVFKVALIISYLQIIKHVMLDEYVEVFRVLLSVAFIIELFYVATLLGKELLYASIILVAYFIFTLLSTPKNELLALNSIALITPMLFVLLLKVGGVVILCVLFLVVMIVILQSYLILSRLHLNISRVFDERAVKPMINRLKKSELCNRIKLLFLKYIKLFCIKTTESITRISSEVKNLELKLFHIFKFFIMRILYTCSSVNLDLERTLGSAIKVLENVLQVAVKTELKFEKYASKVIQSITKLEYVVEHFFISMLMVVIIMLLLTIVFYLISLLI